MILKISSTLEFLLSFNCSPEWAKVLQASELGSTDAQSLPASQVSPSFSPAAATNTQPAPVQPAAPHPAPPLVAQHDCFLVSQFILTDSSPPGTTASLACWIACNCTISAASCSAYSAITTNSPSSATRWSSPSSSCLPWGSVKLPTNWKLCTQCTNSYTCAAN